jgi:putative flippase GtrA
MCARTVEPTRVDRLTERLRTLLEREIVLFLIMGTVNTVLTQLLYMALLLVTSYGISYSLSYVVGVPLAYVLNSKFVFKARMSWKKMLQYPSVYLVQYALGMALMVVVVEWIGIPEWIAPVPILALVIPVTFLMTRFIIKAPEPGRTPRA